MCENTKNQGTRKGLGNLTLQSNVGMSIHSNKKKRLSVEMPPQEKFGERVHENGENEEPTIQLTPMHHPQVCGDRDFSSWRKEKMWSFRDGNREYLGIAITPRKC